MACVPTDIWTKNFPNTSLERYLYTSLFYLYVLIVKI
jgi:hypothetical protein